MHGSVCKEDNWKPQAMAVMVATDLLFCRLSSGLSSANPKGQRTDRGGKDLNEPTSDRRFFSDVALSRPFTSSSVREKSVTQRPSIVGFPVSL
jgi:hypothetical protein